MLRTSLGEKSVLRIRIRIIKSDPDTHPEFWMLDPDPADPDPDPWLQN
jgi:hypothetical protein